MKKFICNYPWTHFEVNNPNGDVTMCCDNSTVLGNVNQGSIEEIWNGPGFQEMRRRMRDQGAHALCPRSCPVLHGLKNYQKLEWHADLPAGSVSKGNAELNDIELAAGKTKLESKPRWMRYAYSYKCNLDCYHCYQREDALLNDTLPDSFMKQVYDLAPYYQVMLFFGGEPFLYKPVLKMMEEIEVEPDCKFFMITNGTLLTDRMFENLETRNIGLFAVSLDAASAGLFDTLRVRGRTASWDTLMANLSRIAELHKRKGFQFQISMTVNSMNCHQIEDFVDLGLSVDAEPLLLLVSNPDGTSAFQRQYLHFTAAQLAEIAGQIEQSLVKVRARNMPEAEAGLVRLESMLREHRRRANSIVVFNLRRVARTVFYRLPTPVQYRIRHYLS